MTRIITCQICGRRFDPASHPGCKACPLNRSCNLVCCPACGTQTIDLDRSTLVRVVEKWFPRNREEQRK